MTHRGPFQPLLLCDSDSVILCRTGTCAGHRGAGIALMVCGQVWPEAGAGRTTPETPEVHTISTACSKGTCRPGSGEGRARGGVRLPLPYKSCFPGLWYCLGCQEGDGWCREGRTSLPSLLSCRGGRGLPASWDANAAATRTQPRVGEMGSIRVGAALAQHLQCQQGQPRAQRGKQDSWGCGHHPSQAPGPAACRSEVSARAVAAARREGDVVLSPVMEKTPGSLCSFPRCPCDSVPRGELLSTEPLTHTAASQQPTKGWSFSTLQ